MSKFSQGRWYVDMARVLHSDDNHESIAYLITTNSPELDDANATLITAAPKMYELLREAVIALAKPDTANTAIKISTFLGELDMEEEYDE